jgi:apolipoprotein N-acyltransferase
VVQAALTGDSAAFDARGRELAWAGPSYRGSLTVSLELPAATAQTPFDRLGNYVPLTALAIAAIAVLLALFRFGFRGRPAAPAVPRDGPPADRADSDDRADIASDADVASDTGRAPDREVTSAQEAHAQESLD